MNVLNGPATLERPGPWPTPTAEASTMAKSTLTPFQRVMARTVKQPNGCWEWQGAVTNGYGCLSVGGKGHRAHRITYEALSGPIPDGLVIDHVCRNRRCVNPDHLEPVTLRENILRGVGVAAVMARKRYCKNGQETTLLNGLAYHRHSDGDRPCRDQAVAS